MTRQLVLIVIVIANMFLSGCSSTTEHKKTGFLSNYEQLTPSTEFEDAKIYKAPGFDGPALASVQSIHIEPFEVWLKRDNLTPLGSEQIRLLVGYFHRSLESALSPYYEIVDTPDENSITIRGAFSSIKVTEPELEPTDFIPFRVVLNAGNAAYLEATNQQDVVTQVGIEVEFLKDSPVIRYLL